MNKSDFLSSLKKNLSSLSEAERHRTIEFYSEAIDDRLESGMSEEEAVKDLGATPEEIAEFLIDTEKENNEKSSDRSDHFGGNNQNRFFKFGSPAGCLEVLIVVPILILVIAIIIPLIFSITFTVGVILLLLLPVVILAIICYFFRKKIFHLFCHYSNRHGMDKSAIKEHREFATVKQIEFDDDNALLKMGKSSDDNIHLNYWNSVRKKYICSCNDGNLVIKGEAFCNSKGTPFEILLPTNCQPQVFLQVKNMALTANSLNLTTFNISGNNMQAALKNLNLSNILEITMNNGKVDLDAIETSGSIAIKGDNGAVNIINSYAHNECDIKFQNSKIDISAIKIGKSLKIATSIGIISGTIKGDSKEYDAPEKLTTSGSWHGEKKAIHLNCSIGKINVRFTP